MTGFDTNLLVRYLVKDDPEQNAVVERVVQECLEAGEAILLNGIVLCETVWVLQGGYGVSREVVAEVLEKILLTRQFQVDDRDLVWRAVARYRQGRGDFADYLIGEKNAALGCERTLTFDRGLDQEPGFHLL